MLTSHYIQALLGIKDANVTKNWILLEFHTSMVIPRALTINQYP